MLFLDHTQVKYCKLQGKDKLVSGIIYNSGIFTKAKAFPKEDLELAIKECREDYLDHEERSKIPTLLIKEKNSVGIWLQNKAYKKENIIEVSGREQSEDRASAKGGGQPTADLGRISVRQVAAQMRSPEGVEIKTRRYKLKLYQRCFLGNEAVDWIVETIKVSRADAVKIGQKMLEKGLINHVTNDHQFKDESLFYRFDEDKGKSIWNSNI